MKRREVFLAAAAVVGGALVAPSPARAAASRARLAADLAAAPNLVADQAAAARDLVRWLSVRDPRASVRSAAETALNGDAAEFIRSGHPMAVNEADRDRLRQLDYANATAAAHPAPTHPWVNSVARRAANGSDAELAAFAKAGFAAELAKDQANIPYDDGAAYVTPDDHDYVWGLSRYGTGTVLERAAEVQTDADVAEFLRHGWISAATIDVEAHRAQYVVDEWIRWQDARQVVRTAVSIDEAAREGLTSPLVAVQAWNEVSTRFARQPSGWTQRERYAHAQLDEWLRNLATAGSMAGPHWAAFAAKGTVVRSLWVTEINAAIEQTAWWTTLIRYAQDTAAGWLRPTG
ncbi:hypothetical protein [Paractinoplanes rishiriensis]|uniref:hypothetical protein n=1 Tax=Paractinoplanes rishiriensis TaxID=1050105 RepID=UPI0019426CF0|nr:hypothetical protein [Actinoplanes rishiriensis]